QIPNPFERGDIVRSHSAIGIVETSQAEWTELMENQNQSEGLDYYDAVITVEFPSEGGGFFHDHISPLELEKIDPADLEDGAEKELLEVAQAILAGGGSLDWLTRASADYREAMRP
ncbi:MAG: hypothetical protein IJA73_04560, partial [Oscillospiraceae bacterium]|nr:hypothetical protein [Oscillospiraceae bacterium]